MPSLNNAPLGDTPFSIDDLLDAAIATLVDTLVAFASDGDATLFSDRLSVAFGPDLNRAAADALYQDIIGDTFTPPSIKILTADELQGAQGAFSSNTQTIFLSEGLLASQNSDRILDVLLEELGHSFDEQLNTADSSGDEGAIFSSVVRGKPISEERLARLRSEDDSGSVIVNDEVIPVERATLTVETDVDDTNPEDDVLSLREAIAEANPGDIITFSDNFTIDLSLGELLIDESITIDGDLDDDGTPDVTIDGQDTSRVFNVYADDETLDVTIDGLTIQGGFDDDGGGINNSENLTVISSTITGNTATSNGGGINNTGSLEVSDSTVRFNYGLSGTRGGGISSTGDSALLTVSNSTINGNEAYSGGGIYSNGDITTIVNSTISGNEANPAEVAGGGGLFVTDNTTNILNSTIAFNSSNTSFSDSYDGGLVARSSSISITSTIIYGNYASSFGEVSYSTPGDISSSSPNLSSGGNNLIGVADADAAAVFDADPTTVTDDPQLAPLANNGGPTETHAISEGSSAIDAGANPEGLATDQRGEPREQGAAADIGAFESDFGAIAIVNLSAVPTTGTETDTTEITLTLTASDVVSGDQTVDLALSGTAVGADFSGVIPTELTIPDGSDEVSVVLTIDDDAIAEGLETATFTISNPTAGIEIGSSSEVDVSIVDNDAAVLELTVDPTSISEDGGIATGTVTRNTDTTDALVVELDSDDTSEAVVPATVTIEAGQTSAEFDITGVDDAIVDGDQDVTISAFSPILELADSAELTVEDDEVAALELTIDPTSISEDGGIATGTVTRNTDTTDALVIELDSDDASEAVVPATVTIEAGQTSAEFDITIVDDAIADGDQDVTISGFAPTLELADSAEITVEDDEIAALELTIDPTSISEDGGIATGTITRNTDTTNALVVELDSDDTSEAAVPTTVTIEAGETSAQFDITIIDDAIADGDQDVTISGFAPTLELADSAEITVEDDEIAALELTIDPTSISEDGGIATGTVTRNTDTTDPLVITLTSDDTSEAVVPEVVTIEAGETSAQFDITGVDDTIADGDQDVTISAVAGILEVETEATITVEDDDSDIDIAIDKNFIGLDTFNLADPEGSLEETLVALPEQGEVVSFELIVSNNGTTDASEVQIQDLLDDRLAIQDISIDGEATLIDNSEGQNIDLLLSLAAGETRTITVTTAVDFDPADNVTALPLSITFGDDNPDLIEYQNQTIEGSVFVSNTEAFSAEGSTEITFNPFLEVSNTATATLLDEDAIDTDLSNNSDTDEFNFVRVFLEGTLADNVTEVIVTSLGPVTFDVDPFQLFTGQVFQESMFLGTEDIGQIDSQLFFDVSGLDLTDFENATGDEAVDEFLELVEAGTFSGSQFADNNPKPPFQPSQVTLTRLFDGGDPQPVDDVQVISVAAAEIGDIETDVDIAIDKNFIGLDTFNLADPEGSLEETLVALPEQGEIVSFELIVSNNGTTDASEVQIQDLLDDRLAIQDISIDGEATLIDNSEGQNIDLLLSLAAGETRTITVTTAVDFDPADNVTALPLSITFGDDNPDLIEYQNQTIEGSVFVSNTEAFSAEGSTEITFNPFLEVSNTATATLLDEDAIDTDLSNNSDTDEFNFVRVFLEGTLADNVTEVIVTSLGPVTFDVDPFQLFTGQVFQESMFLGTEDIGQIDSQLFFDVSGLDLTDFENATGDAAVEEFLELVEAGTFSGSQFADNNPKPPFQPSQVTLTRLFDGGDPQPVDDVQVISVAAAEIGDIEVADIDIAIDKNFIGLDSFNLADPEGSLEETLVALPEQGEVVSFELIVSNHGSIDAHEVQIQDLLDDRLALQSISIDDDYTLIDNSEGQNIDLLLSLEAGETRTITVTTTVDFDPDDSVTALPLALTFGDENPDLIEYQGQTVEGSVFVSSNESFSAEGSTEITFNPFLEVSNTATVTLLDEGVIETDLSNNSDTDEFSFVRVFLDGTLADDVTEVVVTSLGPVTFDVDPFQLFTGQVFQESMFLGAEDIGQIDSQLFFDVSGLDLTDFENATGDEAFDEFLALTAAGTFSGVQFSDSNPKEPDDPSQITLSRLFDGGPLQPVDPLQDLSVDRAELDFFGGDNPTELTETGWQKNDFILGEWTPGDDIVFDLADGIIVNADVTANTLDGDDVINGAVEKGIAVNILGTLILETGNDSVSGLVEVSDHFVEDYGSENIGISNDGNLSAGSDNDELRGTVEVDGDGNDNIGVRFRFLSPDSRTDTGDGDDSVVGAVTINGNGSNNIGIENTSIFSTSPDHALISNGDQDSIIGIVTVTGIGDNNIGIFNSHFLGTDVDHDSIRGEVQGNGFGIVNFSLITTASGDDSVTGLVTGDGFGIRNTALIDLGEGNDTIRAEGADAFSGFAGGGRIDLGAGDDQILGFGRQTVHGGDGIDEAVFGFDLDHAITLGSSASNAIDITANDITMSFTDVERFTFANGVFTLDELTNLATI